MASSPERGVIVPFTEAHIPEAGRLLAARQGMIRNLAEHIPTRLTDPEVAPEAVRAAWERPFASGFCYFENDRMRAYLFGDMVFDQTWGRAAWVRYAGSGVDQYDTKDWLHPPYQIIRELYAAAAVRWVDFGCFAHFIIVPVGADPIHTAALHLSFGLEQAHGYAKLADVDLTDAPLPPGVEIRRATEEDRRTLEDFSTIIWRHQIETPVFGVHLPERQLASRVGYGEQLDDPEATIWIAFLDGKPAGFHAFYELASDDTDPKVPGKCIELGIAGTLPEARRRGVGAALTRHGFREARNAGAEYCLTDWRVTNLTSSVFWPKMGFHPYAFRMVRRLDPRILWMRGTDHPLPGRDSEGKAIQG